MLPQQLISSLQGVKGFNEVEFIKAHNITEPVISIRINPAKTTAENTEIKNLCNNIDPVPWCQHGLYLKQRPYFTAEPYLHAGAFYVQEASSMFLWHILQQIFQNNTNKITLDLCAAPGGKSTLLSSFFTNGLVVSNEVIKPRNNILCENITKWGNGNVVVTCNDPKDFNKIPGFFDCIVVDAPCSGSGLFRKDKNAINEWSEENVELCSQRQMRIIADSIGSLKQDGFLIYSTCSFSQQENEDILDWVAKKYDMESVNIKVDDSFGIVATQSHKVRAVGYRFYPNLVLGEGFFIAVLQKKTITNKIKLKQQFQFIKPTKTEVSIVQNMIHFNNELLFKQNNSLVIANETFVEEYKTLIQNLYIKKMGVEVGEVKGKDFIPAHSLATSTIEIKGIEKIEINKQQAIQYLAKKEVNINVTGIGWALVVYKNVGVGFIKMLKTRYNNYYPTDWRIIKTTI